MPVSASAEAVVPETRSGDNIIEVRDLVKEYPIERGIVFRKKVGTVHAVDGVSFDLKRGSCLAIVGESGCGKSTIGRLLMGLEPPTSGTVTVNGVDLATLSGKEMARSRRDLQIILQDPYTSLDPRMTVGGIIGEPFDIHPNALPAGMDRKQAVKDLMDRVGLNPEFINRYPHQFSGGQRQRIGIARALALRPKVIIADEPVSALDVSVQAQVMNLLMDLCDDLGLSYVFISHDLAVVRQIADTIMVMYLGKVMEYGPAEQIYTSPRNPYTAALLSAVPIADPVIQRERQRILLSGDLPSPADPPAGCRFCTRCFQVQDRCRTEPPPLVDIGNGQLVACHFPLADAVSDAISVG